MTAAPPVAPAALADADPAAGLAALRGELDRLDDALHDLLMERAALVARVAATAGKGRIAVRPGREAAILRRLLDRHDGRSAPQGLVRVWRELFAASIALQGGAPVAVCDLDPAARFVQCAREHFGALAPLRVHHSPAQAVGEVSAGTAAVAVLPLPAEDEPPRDAWWTALLQKDEPRIHVVARLPFWSPRPDGAPRVQALVVSPVPPDPSGQDRSLLGLELDRDISRARLAGALAAAGLSPDTLILRRDPGAPVAHALADVDGLVDDRDPRLAALAGLLQPPVVLGAYAVPAGVIPAGTAR